MNKRISKKYLTEDEKTVLELYRQCDSVSFARYSEKDIDSAKVFTDRLSNSQVEASNEITDATVIWTSSEKGKIAASAFLR